MRKILFGLVFAIFLLASISADILISQQPDDSYNMGDVLNVPLKVVSVSSVSDFLYANLLCNGVQTEIHKEYIVLTPGQEKSILMSVPLISSLTGNFAANCVIKVSLGDEYTLAESFKLSDKILVEVKSDQTEFKPSDSIVIEGNAQKENGKGANGFVSVKMSGNGQEINLLNSVVSGYFSINYDLPSDIKAGTYTFNIEVYEKDASDSITNKGNTDYSITVSQVPTNLEIIIENNHIKPGENLRVRGILHDQTGEIISSSSTLKILDSAGVLVQQLEGPTGEFFEYPIENGKLPQKFFLKVESNNLSADGVFEIVAQPAINVDILNQTIQITNVGNVVYNKSVLIKIGETPQQINVLLDIGKSKKYSLTAPKGEYDIEVVTDEGLEPIKGRVILTGASIGVKEPSTSIFGFVRYPFVWIFILLLVGFIGMTILRKGYSKSFFGYFKGKSSDMERPVFKPSPIRKSSLITTRNIADLSLSLKGDKQDVSMVCVKIKNMRDIDAKESNAGDTLQKIVDFAEARKAFVYENSDCIFFILAPVKTKTFNNEMVALEIANKSKEVLDEHNKMFRQKLEYGIGLNYGSIVAKIDESILQFMSLGTFITTIRKIASLAERDILLGDKIKERTMNSVRAQKVEKGGMNVYAITEMRERDKHTKFISEFMHRQNKDKK